MPRPHQIFSQYVGRNGPIPTETMAQESGTSETTISCWKSEHETREPSYSDLQSLLGSTLLPIEFKTALVNDLLRFSADLRVSVVGCERDDTHPMTLSIVGLDDWAKLQRLVDEATCTSSPGGAHFTGNEAAAVESVLSRFDVLTARIRKAIEKRRLKVQVG